MDLLKYLRPCGFFAGWLAKEKIKFSNSVVEAGEADRHLPAFLPKLPLLQALTWAAPKRVPVSLPGASHSKVYTWREEKFKEDFQYKMRLKGLQDSHAR